MVSTTPSLPERKNIRLKEYDYSQAGAYFITICVQNRKCLFGHIVNQEMQLNDAGKMIDKWWNELQNKFTNIQLDQYVIMPNHFHGIVFINNVPDVSVGADLRVCPQNNLETGAHAGAPLQTIIQWFKTMTTNDYIRHVKNDRWQSFDKKLWQRNYYEHVIRNDVSLNEIRDYIINNPLNWEKDSLYSLMSD